MWRKLLNLKFVIVLCLLAAGALTFRLGQKIFLIEQIDLEWASETESFCLQHQPLCDSFKTQAEATLAANIGQKIWNINIENLREQSRKNTWFKNVFVHRSYPDKIKLEVELEIPEVLVLAHEELLAVGANGQLLAPVKVAMLPSLPILRGENFLRDADLRSRAITFLKDFPTSGEMSVKNVAEVTYSKDENFSLMILPSKSIVKMTNDRVPLRAARVAQVIEYLNGNQMNGRVIDARFSKKVLVRLRKGS